MAAFVVILVMRPALEGVFFFDDNPNIVHNTAIQIDELSLDSLKQSVSGPSAGPLGRPISVISFAMTHYFFGLSPYAFKATNLVIHLLNGLLVAWLIKLLVNLYKIRAPIVPLWLAIWVSAIWMVHPINILPVMLSVQRMTLLSSMFVLLALISYVKWFSSVQSNRWMWLGLAWAVFWPLAVLSKETGLLFPLYVLVLTFFYPGSWKEKNWVIGSMLSLLIVTACVLPFHLGWDWLERGYSTRPFSLTERLMTEARVLWFYAAQIALPDFASYGIYLDDFSISKSLFHPLSTIASILGWALVIFAIFVWRSRIPLLSLALAWFIVGHSLESTFLPLEIAHEYRNYLPSLGLILSIGYAGIYIQRLKLDHPKFVVIALAIIAFSILSLLTYLRAQELGSPLVGPQIEVSRHPSSPRANHAAATSLFKAGYGDKNDPIGALQIQHYFEQSGKADTNFKHGYLGLIVWACASDRQVKNEWVDNFAHRLQFTKFSPNEYKIPGELLKHLLYMPACLNSQRALQLFNAGAANKNSSQILRASFYKAAADFELLVSLNPVSAKYYLSKAAELTPEDKQLNQKLKTFSFLD